MRTLRKKRKNKTKKRKKSGGGFFTYPGYYVQQMASFFTLNPPVAYGNTSNVKPFPYFQSK